MPNRRIGVRRRRKTLQGWHVIAITMGIAVTIFRFQSEISPRKMEYGYSRGIYPYIADALSWVGRWVPAPYSASEIFLGLIFLAMLIWFAFNFSRSLWRRQSILILLLISAFHGIAILSGGYFFYLTNWGLNYLREPVYVSLAHESPSELSPSDYEQVAGDMITLISALPKSEYPNLREMDHLIDAALGKNMEMASEFPIPSPPPTKFLIFNEWMNACGISGIFLPIFMEPHINSDLLLWERPFVMAHEKAHFMGFASETDANFIAGMTCLNAESPVLRYSGAMYFLLSLRRYLPQEKWDDLMTAALSPAAQQDIRAREERIQHHLKQYTLTRRFSQKVNDTYLKLNSQELGIRAYQAAVPHLVAWWKARKSDAKLTTRSPNRSEYWGRDCKARPAQRNYSLFIIH